MTEQRSSSLIIRQFDVEVFETPGIPLLDMSNAAIVDSEGIPLSSDRGNKKDLKGIDFDYQACPFSNSPSRFPDAQPHEVPMSGLERRRLAETYPGMIGTLNTIRNYYIEHARQVSGIDNDAPLSIYEAREVLMSLAYLPHYLAFRKENPIPKKGKIPPDLMVIGNVGSGSLAALSGYIETNFDGDLGFYNQVPDVSKMIEDAEKRGKMVGDKTVCAASPEQMNHFLTAVFYGPKSTKNTSSLSDFVEESEMQNLLDFGKAMYEGIGSIHLLSGTDNKYGLMISTLLQEEKWGKVELAMKEYEEVLFEEFQYITFDQAKANIALGQGLKLEPVTLNSLLLKGIELPTAMYIRQFRKHEANEKAKSSRK